MLPSIIYSLDCEQAGNTSIFTDDEVNGDSEETISVESIS